MEESFTKKPDAPVSLWMALPWGIVSTLPSGIQGVIKRFSVDRRSLSIISTVARGEYGCIVNGQLSVDRTDFNGGFKGVMMKLLIGFKEEYGHHNEIAKFLEHATLLRGLEHPNIEAVLRTSVDDNLVPLVLYPIVEYGNLHNFLTFCRISPRESPLNPVTLKYKVNFALQIVYAMQFLSDKGVIHPDLALRNCLLDTNYLVKVSDGALSQEFYPECYYTIRGAIRPVRWAAQETLQEGLCTSQSNVWSYGVTLWEVVTLGEFPYKEVNNNRSIPSHVMMGARLSQPVDCPDYLFKIMLDCWDPKAEKRPNFSTILKQMEDINDRLASPQTTHTSYSTPKPIREEDQLSTVNHVTSRDRPLDISGLDYSPVPTAYESRRKSGGRSSFIRASPTVNKRSSQNSVSVARSSHLSLTFSILSDDFESSSSISGDEEGPKALSPLPESVVFQMLPSLLNDDYEQEQETAGVQGLHSDSPSSLVSSLLESHTNNTPHEQENSSRYALIPSTFISPAPLTPSTTTTRLTPCETTSYNSSQFGPGSTLRSDGSEHTPLPTASPSPDLTSKSSTFGGEEVNPSFGFTPLSSADVINKTSTPDYFGTPANQDSNLYTSTKVHLNGNTYGFGQGLHDNTKVPGTSGMYPVMENNTPISIKTSEERCGYNGSQVNGLVNVNGHRKGNSDEGKTVKSTERGSIDLELGDLSSDLMATFDSWNV